MGSTTLDADRETARIQAIEACDILDTRRESCFDRLVFVAAQLFGVPMAVFAVVHRDHVSVKAGVGPLLREWPRDMTFCDTVVRLDQMLVVEDAAID